MALNVDASKLVLFEEIFARPTIERMLELSPQEFELFIAYVFTCAGYRVEYVGDRHFPLGPGVDLNLYTTQSGQRPTARVEVRRWSPDNLLTLNDVRAFGGALGFANDVPGYLVTTSDFHANAWQAAMQGNGRVRLVNGAQLLRYIIYLRGSRVTDAVGLKKTATLTPPDWLCDPAPVQHCAPKRTTVLTLANHKGGVAKTTSALNFGLALARRGEHVLLVDLDGQANLTMALPLPDPRPHPPRNAPVPERELYISSYFTGQTPDLASLVQETRFDSVYLLAANDELHRLDTGGAGRLLPELAFVRDLHSAALTPQAAGGSNAPFDWIILDTPPAQSFFTRLALAAAHYVVIPIQVDAFGTYGINRVSAAAESMRALIGEGVAIVGCLRTRWRSTAGSRNALAKLQADLGIRGIRLFHQEIPLEDRIEQAHQATMGGGIRNLFGFVNNAAAVAYNNALDELISEVRPNVHEPR